LVLVTAALVGLSGCKSAPETEASGEASSAVNEQAAPDESADQSADTSDDETADKQAASTPAPCENPELWMATYKLDELAEPYCAACADKVGICSDGQMHWEMLKKRSERNLASTEYEYALEALRAWHGQSVADPGWESHIQGQPWFQQAKDREMSEAARHNIEELKASYSARNKVEQLSPGDLPLVAEWFQKLDDPEALSELAALSADGEAVTPEQFSAFVAKYAQKGAYEFGRRTPVISRSIETVPDWLEGKLGDETTVTRVLEADPSGDARISCTEQFECDGFEHIRIYMDGNRSVVALETYLAG
jgi:hypothetical protein